MLDRFRLMDYLRLFRASGSKIRYLWYFLLPLLLTAGLRETGATRQWDLFALDRLLTIRPPEAIDDRIVIVTIDEDDLRKESVCNSISDKNLARAIELIAAAKPSVIGVDIIRDGKIDPQLKDAFQKHENVIGLAKVVEPGKLNPPPELTPSRVGFGDYEPDFDGSVRRAMLAIFEIDREPKYSFAFQIASLYLQQQGKKIHITPKGLELGSHRIYPFRITDSSSQNEYFDLLINYRHAYPAFSKKVKLADILANKLPNLKNKIVLIGYTAITKQDFIHTSVIPNPEINGNMYGIEYHGHIISQLVSASLNNRVFIQTLPLWGDYLWFFACIASSGLVFKTAKFRTPFWQLFILFLVYATGVCLSIYFLFMAGWLLPIGLTLTILIINIPMLLSFYQREQLLVAIAEKRRQAISDTFNAIHNGPLQELSLLLRAVKSDNISLPEVSNRLEELNQHIRLIGESLQGETTTELELQETLVLGNGDLLDLNLPLNELFHLVSERTLSNQMYPNLINLKIKIIDFQEVPIQSRLSIDDKRQLCQFLEESIGNVGKYAEGATRLQLIGKVDEKVYHLSIEDNGRGTISDRVGDGTKQAKRLAARLKGKFTRTQKPSQGVICAIEWGL